MLNTTNKSGKKTPGISEASYGSLLQEFRPRLITSERENKKALAQIEKLMSKDKRTLEEETLYSLLVHLVSTFEEVNYPIPEASPSDVLKHLMEENGVRQKDLAGIIGSKGVVSEVVNGKRGISKEQAKRLGEFFNVPPSMFI